MRSLMSFVIVFAVAGAASALTVEVPVTTDYVHANKGEFTVRAKEGKDGLVHFTVTRHLSQPRYLVAHFEVRDADGAVLTTCDSPAFVREKTATYYFALLAKHLATARFHLSEHSFNEEEQGGPIPLVGGTDYQFRLEDFAPTTAAKSPPSQEKKATKSGS